MKKCANGHDEIMFEGRACPLCKVLVERDELKNNIDELEERCSFLEDTIDDLESKKIGY